MRFPGLSWMDRVIGKQENSMVSYINRNVPKSDQITMIPYVFATNNTFLRYNNILLQKQDNLTGDPFQVGILKGGNIDDDFAVQSPAQVLEDKFKEFMDALSEDFDDGFDYLMEYDSISVRQYFLEMGYSHQEIDWLETTNDATNHYDLSLSQTILEEWIFDAAPLSSW